MPDSLDAYLRRAGVASLVVAHQAVLDRVPAGVGTVVALPGKPEPPRDTWDAVTLVVPDRLALRSVALPELGRARRLAVWLAGGPGIAARTHADWPALDGMRSRRLADGSWLLVVRFRAPAPAAGVLVEVARQAVRGDTAGNAGLWTDETSAADDVEVPADVVLGATEPPPTHPVLGRAPVVVAPEVLGPLDERVLNPVGFQTTPTQPVTPLPHDAVLGEALVTDLRGAAAVPVTWPDDPDPDRVRTVAGLAMSGVPLTSTDVPAWAADLLGGPLVAALVAGLESDDDLAREEHSVVLRRAALDAFSIASWRRRAASRAGVRVADQPAVSVVLATKRPELLDFALRQVARQRGLDLELVLAPHGFDVDVAATREALGDGVRLVLRPQPADLPFGDVLHGAASAISGDLVLKMDDDDWYSPDTAADLVRSHGYSGAEVVGMPAEFHYLTEPDITVTRGHTSEVYARFVAGGTLMIERALLREVGGFRSVRKYVDAQLLAAVTAAGGAIYRTHGLGYVLRRNPTGHTWQVDLDYLLDPSRVARRWDGFRPSRLLETPVLGSPT
ncbi:MAG: glycosyltransferase [Nocardioides sp.]